MKKYIVILVIICFSSGCAGPRYRINPQFSDHVKNIKTAVGAPIKLDLYRITAGGVQEKIDEWCLEAEGYLKSEIKRSFRKKLDIEVNFIDRDELNPASKKIIDELLGLYEGVAASIYKHTYTEGHIFKDKLDNFDYTMGPGLDEYEMFFNGDASLFVYGTRSYWTGGRVALALWSSALAYFTGVYMGPVDQPEWICLGLVDNKTGNILWFEFFPSPGDFRDQKHIEEMVKVMCDDFIKAKKE